MALCVTVWESPLLRTTRSILGKLSLAALGLFLAGGAFCAAPHDPELVKYVDDALDIMEEHSIYRNVMYWQEFREIVFERTEELTELSHAREAVENALLWLGDRHGRLIPPEEVDALVNDGIESSRLSAWTPVEAKLIGDRFGYVTVPSVVGRNARRVSHYVDEMHEAIRSVDSDDVCGWIVDLRDTTGGNIWAMLAGIGPVLGSGEAGGEIGADRRTFIRRVENGRAGPAEPSRRAYKLKNRYPPVAVLIGRETSGSGEATALAFVGREMSSTFGEPTAGLTTGRMPFPLSDGSYLSLSRSMLTDRIHRPFLDSIQPQVKAKQNEIIDIAVDWLGHTDVCR